jgi:dTDP-glucose 4,6-dehydratase
MRLLVTGGAGFIGANFIQYWIKTHPDDEIINLDALTYAGNLENLTSIASHPGYRFVHGSICDADLVRESMQGVDTVVHFAAETHVDRSILNPGAFIETNVTGTYVLLETARQMGNIRFHHVSTDEVFGALALNSAEKFDEHTPYMPHSPYSASKAASDHLVRAYHDTYRLPITITNCSNNFGPYQFPEKFIPHAVINLLTGKKILIYGDGLYVRDWLYVEDHCRAIDRVITDGKIGETYCVGGMTEDVSNIAIAGKIATLLNKDPETSIKFIKDRPGHDRRYAVDWTKINAELGWEPQHDFDTWLSETVAWYVHHREWWEKILNGEYQTYYTKQYMSSHNT